MNKFEIFFSSTFKEELDNIYNYIYSSLNSPITAVKFYKMVKNSIQNLDFFPERFPKIELYNLRKLTIKNFIIIYKIDEKAEQIYILHIFHGNQDYFNKL